MKKTSFIRFAAFVTCASALSLGLASADLTKGQVRKITGDAMLIKASGASQKITQQTEIPVGSKVVTGEGAELAVDWMDGAHSIIKPNTTIEVQSLQISEDNGVISRKVVLKLDSGKILSEYTHTKTSTYVVKSGDCVIVDKGTSFGCSNNGSTVSGSVYTGSVAVSEGGGAPTTVTAGHSFTSNSGGNPSVATNSDSDNADGVALFSSFGGDGGNGNGSIGDTSGAANGGVGAPPASNPLTDGAPAAGGSNPGNALETSSQLIGSGKSNPASQVQ